MTPEWRNFEKLVSRLEEVLSPHGMIVRSPDYIPDQITGGMREVDASIRPKHGGSPVRVFECRDRSKVQDVTWIEQIVTKAADHGIPTTAVSSSGFTSSAQEKAKHYGIETRDISKIDQGDAAGWIAVKKIENHIYETDVREVFITVVANQASDVPQFTAEVIASLNRNAALSPVFKDAVTDRMVSAYHILNMGFRERPDIWNGVKANERVLKGAVIEFPDRRYSIETISGFKDLVHLRITFYLGLKVVESPVPALLSEYTGSQRESMHALESSCSIGTQDVLISIFKRAGAQELVVRIETTPRPI